MEALSYKVVKSRKQHLCNFCGCTIEKHTKYANSSIQNDGIYTWKAHLECEKAAENLGMYDNCRDEGLTGDDFKANLVEYLGIKGDTRGLKYNELAKLALQKYDCKSLELI